MTDRTLRAASDLDAISFDDDGLVPVVAQDAREGRVLMLAWADRTALERSLATGEMHFHSRSRDALWRKGETSGNFLRVRSVHADCDGDAVLARVDPTGPACHTGDASCFGAGSGPEPTEDDGTYRGPAGAGETGAMPSGEPTSGGSAADVLDELAGVIGARARDMPEGSYTAALLADENLRLKKLGEETAELILALTRGEPGRVAEEAADLVFHLLVALRGAGASLDDVRGELARRRG